MKEKKSIAIFSMHPVPYSSPFYNELYKLEKKNIVYYLDKLGIKRQYNPYFKENTNNDNYIISNHKHKFLFNLSKKNITGFFSRVNLSAIFHTLFNKNDYILINGYQTLTSWLVWIASYLSSKKVIFKGETINTNKNFLKKIIIKIFLSRVSIVLYSCKGNFNFYKFIGINKSKLLSCPSCVDYDYFEQLKSKPNKNIKTKFYKSLKTKKDEKIIIFVSKFIKRKNPLELINALSNLNFKYKIIFAGNGPMTKIIKENCEKHYINYEITNFLDQERLSYLYSISDLYVNCSTYDASPKTLNEAVFFNVPIICPNTNIGQSNDLVIEGLNGFTYEQGNILDLSKKIQNALNIDRNKSLIINNKIINDTHPKKSALRLMRKLND